MAINFLNVTNTLPEIQINDTDNNPRLAFKESGVVSGGVSTTGGDLVLEASSGIERARILSTGNFGIGTATPTAAKLVVASAGTDPQIMIKNTAGNNAIILLEDNSGGSQNASITFDQGSQNTLTIATGYQSPSDLNRIYLAPAGNTVLTAIGGSGGISTAKVGIGTTTPENRLHLLTQTTDETQQLLIQNGNSGDAAIKFNISGDTYSLGIDNSDSDKFKLSFGNLGTNDRLVIDSTGNVGIGTTSPTYKLTVSGAIEAGGVVTYSKATGSLDTTGYAVAGLTTGFNGASAGFEFKCYGGTGKYQRISYSCYCDSTTWRPRKMIDEGSDTYDVVASADGTTITFTFKTRSGSQGYTPRIVIEATGHSINSTYA